MNRMPRIRRWLSVPAGTAQNCWPLPPTANWAEGSPSADMCSAVGWLSFRRIVDIPFDACLAALESWPRTGQDGELHHGQGLLCGPIERDRDSDTCRIQVRLARRPPCPPLLMRLDIDRLSASRTALELIPCKRSRPTAGYFRAGHRLLDSLTHALQAWARNASRTTSARSRLADVPQPQAAPGALAPGPPQAATNPAAQAAPSRQQMQSGTAPIHSRRVTGGHLMTPSGYHGRNGAPHYGEQDARTTAHGRVSAASSIREHSERFAAPRLNEEPHQLSLRKALRGETDREDQRMPFTVSYNGNGSDSR